jgi:hypothetical protein
MTYSEESGESRRPRRFWLAGLFQARLGGPPSAWALTLFWVSVAVLGIGLALLVSSFLL